MKKALLHINKVFAQSGQNGHGFSLVEILVSISVFLVFVIAISDVSSNVTIQKRDSANRERATILAEEALEASRNIRDSAINFANLPDGTHGLSTSGNVWSLAGTSDITDIFTRTLNITTISENQKKVDVTVSWVDQTSLTNSVFLSTYLTNWRAILNITAGLTVNKIVVNHGGSKVASDFTPYKVSTTVLAGDPPVSTLVETPITIGVASTLNQGTYTVSETTSSNYTSTFSGDCNSSGIINLVANTVNTCLITNEEKLSHIVVTKVVTNHGGSKVASDFTLLVDSNPVTSGVSNVFNSGSHTVSEVSDSAYIMTISGDCDSGGSVTLVPGVTKNCTVTNEEKIIPTVTTPTVTSITTTTATLGANVTSLGIPASISARGTCYGTTASPSTNCIAEGGTTTGVFTQPITGLTSGVPYYYRGYATNSTGTAYSADGAFTTIAMPTVTTTSPITSIARTTATGGGNVTSDGGAGVTDRGVVWDTSVNPTVALSTKTSNGTGTGSFSSSITSLTCNTLYHVRAYATNSVGTSYGSDVTFTTSACSSIIFIGSTAVNGTTAVIPSHNVGDLLVAFAYRSSSNAPPTVPSGWTTINASGSSNNSSSLAYRIATGSDSGSGWSNATQVVVQVYRGVSASPIGANGFQNANSQVVTYPALSLSVTDGSSWIIGSAGDASKSTPIETAPTGMTMRANIVGASAEASGFDTNGGVSSWTAKNVPISPSNVKWSARTLEIKSN